MKTRKTPLAIFTYNRPDHVRLALASIAGCARLDECCVHIYCDGPRSPAQAPAVEASRHVVHEWASRLDAKVIERPENVGLGPSIAAGVTDLCQQYGRVIVLEDDLVVSPDFLTYMLEALDRYQDEPQIYQISGYMFAVPHPPKPDAFFLPFTTSWGWATWDRAWRILDWNAAGFNERLADPQARRRFDLDDSYPFFALLKQSLADPYGTWGIRWYYAVFNAGGLVLYPQQSLVWNGGFDGSGIHCGKGSDFPRPPLAAFKQARLSQLLTFPEKVVVDDEASNRIKTFMRSKRRPQKQSLINRIRHRIKQYF